MKRYIHANTEKTYSYTIMQLKEMRDTDYGFMSWDFAKEHGFDFDDYEFIYAGEVAGTSPEYALEKLFYTFNMDHPKDFRGHSLSMSDIVVLGGRTYYCDRFGWTDVSDYI